MRRKPFCLRLWLEPPRRNPQKANSFNPPMEPVRPDGVQIISSRKKALEISGAHHSLQNSGTHRMRILTGADTCGEATMFESLKIEGQRDAMRYMTSLLMSVAAHTVVLGALVVFPLVFFNVVEADDLIAILIEPPSTPEPPPAPAAPARVRAVSGTATVRGNIQSVPDSIPEGIPPADEDGEPLYYADIAQDIGIAPEGVPTGNALTRLLETSRQPELPPVRPPVRPAPIKVSGPLQEAKLIHKVSPVYPDLAIRAHASGTVTLEAIIDEEGYVTELKILDGHPLLRNAAFEAVRQWRYMPTLIGGEPVPVVAIVSVVFRFR